MINELTQMIWQHGSGPSLWWPVFPLVWLLLWVAAIITAIVLWRRRRDHHTRSAQSILAEEFARGNITEEEYQRRLATLRLHDKA